MEANLKEKKVQFSVKCDERHPDDIAEGLVEVDLFVGDAEDVEDEEMALVIDKPRREAPSRAWTA
jgi:hypothetical protein